MGKFKKQDGLRKPKADYPMLQKTKLLNNKSGDQNPL
jgi:hypothetical protein